MPPKLVSQADVVDDVELRINSQIRSREGVGLGAGVLEEI